MQPNKTKELKAARVMRKTVFEITGANFLISNNVVLSLQG
jgi:hypothetical protein